MAEFSADRSPKVMPARFSPGAGNIGAQAAHQATRQRQGLGRPQPQQGDSEAEPIGRPQSSENQGQEQDLNYLNLALQHANMRALGREVPYVVWATLTGNYRQYAEPGRPPFDYLEDG